MDLRHSRGTHTNLQEHLIDLEMQKEYKKFIYTHDQNINTLLEIRTIVDEIRFVKKRISTHC